MLVEASKHTHKDLSIQRQEKLFVHHSKYAFLKLCNHKKSKKKPREIFCDKIPIWIKFLVHELAPIFRKLQKRKILHYASHSKPFSTHDSTCVRHPPFTASLINIFTLHNQCPYWIIPLIKGHVAWWLLLLFSSRCPILKVKLLQIVWRAGILISTRPNRQTICIDLVMT